MAINFDKTIVDISNYVKEQGFSYSEEQIYNFYISLKTKPFVIISGISGSGKSKIADLFAEYMEQVTSTKQNYALVPVKPNWTDNRGIFGFHNLLSDTYEVTPALKLFIRALENPDKPFFLVLDEMNLAKVEYYFSDFLSVLESRRNMIIEMTDTNFAAIKTRLGNNITLSEAIILSALQLQSKEFRTVEDYRNTPICQWWLNSNSSGNNNTAQFRTELNQDRNKGNSYLNGYKADGSRLAGKAFWGEANGNSYKLKDLADMDHATRIKVERLIDAYSNEHIKIKQGTITLHNNVTPLSTNDSQPEYNGKLLDIDNYYIPNEIEIPLNVYVIGTVNVDETTYMFSPKVLDRSNVIEFNSVDLFNAYGYGQPIVTNTPLPGKAKNEIDLSISLASSESTKQVLLHYPDVFGLLVSFFEELKKSNKHFGYRVFNEISLYILNYVGEEGLNSDVKNALDLQVLQKILPKINGTEDEIMDLMNTMKKICEDNNLSKSKKKIERMISQLNSTGYATFIE